MNYRVKILNNRGHILSIILITQRRMSVHAVLPKALVVMHFSGSL